ncbi:hypothetical protein B0H13DRAFT_2365580 [Mycena leptocephala]|nr:hypothetical protein B0H13DRAFT_2365580 [Mycena leptocephala]
MHLSGIAAARAEEPPSAQAATPAAAAASTPPNGFYTFVPFPPGVTPTPIAAAHSVNPGPAAAAPAAAPAGVALPPVVTGIPAGLAALLRHTGPWTANELYSVPPTGPLSPVQEITPAPEWYCVTRGRFVGVMDQYAQAHYAIRGVSNAAHKSYTSQAFALDAFNKVVGWGGVEVVRT